MTLRGKYGLGWLFLLAFQPWLWAASNRAAEEKKDSLWSAEVFAGLAFRSLGPAVNSGRICDLAVDPQNPKRYFIAVCSGGVWKTENGGVTFTPIFDKEQSYSIGCITMDPNNPHVLWVGTGENNSQRSVSWGDGVYVSRDGGETWQRVGLEKSEHIGRIVIDPRDSNVVYVAAQGPLWAPGGDRGLYKTTDGGKTWTRVLYVSENTGINEVWMDPRNPDVLYASSYQRRRHVWTLINGGPESTIYKSEDAGKSWRKVERGLPKEDKGKIGLCLSPANPDVLYAIVEAAEGKSGVFRSTNRGESWERRSDYATSSGQYYNELTCDPKDVNTLYAMDTWLHVSTDGGKTFRRVGERTKHVDNHAMWIDPQDTSHWLVGSDGGLYETWDRGATWQFKPNLPVTQFYRVTTDNSRPFYYIYGGTQDNNTLGGPSRTTSASGIVNSDWFVTTGGDGFVTRVDPEDPNILYSESQYGGLVRYDRRSGEEVDIQPQELPGDAPNRWNWDSPLIISPHNPKRLYFASQRVYRSDDRGDSWVPISGDLTRQIDRNQLPVMGKIWSADAVAKNASTSFYGNIVSLTESPLREGLLFVGTDDGLIQITEDGGMNWRRIERVGQVPERTYVSDLEASHHNPTTLYAAFDNHKMGDFTPYLYRSRDLGKTWENIAANLPPGHVVYSIAEDPKDPRLLFAGTEFGIFFSPDGGGRWVKLSGGIPTISVRDIAIQQREDDLVLATFGRGFYVLDDYSPLRGLTREQLEKPALLFPVKPAWAYIERTPLGSRGKGSQGDSYFTAPNPPFGAVFTYYLKEELLTLKEQRRKAEQEAEKQGKTPPYPTPDQLRAEAQEEPPTVILTVSDLEGNVIRRILGDKGKGFHRASWDLRFPPAHPIRGERAPEDPAPWEPQELGPLVAPGTYQVSLSQRVRGVETVLAGPVTFEVIPLGQATLEAKDKVGELAFQRKVQRLQRAVLAAAEVVRDTQERLKRLKVAVERTPSAKPQWNTRLRQLEAELFKLDMALTGDREMARRNEPTLPSIRDRVVRIVSSLYTATAPATGTQKQQYAVAAEEFAKVLAGLRQLVTQELPALEGELEVAGAPHTPGRFPEWSDS
ncbi:MAG: hypothetical protein N2447_08585 [Thermoanaerobaculum sp.]|nr:hypothetical protein [Thermoanaerobaculum sp.]